MKDSIEGELCENCERLITGRVFRTGDDYPLCRTCAYQLIAEAGSEAYQNAMQTFVETLSFYGGLG